MLGCCLGDYFGYANTSGLAYALHFALLPLIADSSVNPPLSPHCSPHTPLRWLPLRHCLVSRHYQLFHAIRRIETGRSYYADARHIGYQFGLRCSRILPPPALSISSGDIVFTHYFAAADILPIYSYYITAYTALRPMPYAIYIGQSYYITKT
jgi:hypothetical protein